MDKNLPRAMSFYGTTGGPWIGIRRARLSRKKWSIPACAITSIVLRASWSRFSGVLAEGAGRSRVGPNIVARLCSDILFLISLAFTLYATTMRIPLPNVTPSFTYRTRWSSKYKITFWLSCGNDENSCVSARTPLSSSMSSPPFKEAAASSLLNAYKRRYYL